MITPRSGCGRSGRTEPGLRPAFTPFPSRGLSSCPLPRSRPARLTSAQSPVKPALQPVLESGRRRLLLGFLADLGLEAAGRPLRTIPLEPIDEALTHTSAGQKRNHERLEFLGDAVLRLAASLFLQRDYPDLAVGEASALRSQLVSDRWLAELGERCRIERVLRIGAMAAGDRAGRATVRAECCEALIGALYESWGGDQGGLLPVQAWLEPHWRRDARELLADPHRHNWKSALQEWSQGQGLGLPHYQCEERSRVHADPRRFHCRVAVAQAVAGEGWGPSRRVAEQEAARLALEQIRPAPTA